MKKQYSKPGIIIENFELVQNIANGCGAAHDSMYGSPTHWSKTTCGWKTQWGQVLWYDEAGGCTNLIKKPTEDKPEGSVSGVCYNNPSGGMVIFNS